MKKINLTKGKEKELIDFYKKGISKRKISLLLNISTSLIDRILKENKIFKYNNGEECIVLEEVILDENLKKVAKCKETGKTFDDIENKSGSITNYIKEKYPDFEIPSSFKRRDFFKKTGKYWYEEFLEINIIEKEEEKEFKKCNYCNWNTIDLENRSGMYGLHLEKIHNIKIEEHVKNVPEDKFYFRKYFEKTNRFEDKEVKKDYVECKICKKKLKVINTKHLYSEHNMTVEEYKIKFGNENLFSQESLVKITDLLRLASEKIENNFISKAQQEISDFLTENGIINILNDKKLLKGIEIDILCEKEKIGIEYNGLYYHSEKSGKKDRFYHISKTKSMQEQGYKLIHIFEDEWIEKKEIIKNKLLHIFDIKNNKTIIHARKCEILELNSVEKSSFLKEHHILGNDRSNIYIGAVHNGELVAVICFDKNRNLQKKTKEGEYELSRLCVKNNYIVSGIASKMLKFFIENYKPKNIISFLDIRWNSDKHNNIYTKLNFKLTKTLKPDFYYMNFKTNRNQRLHKFNFIKPSLKNKFPELYDDNKTEWQIMQEAGYDRIWDCGKYKFELKF